MERDDEIEKISKELEDILRMTSEKKRSSGETETEKKNLIPSENGADEKEPSASLEDFSLILDLGDGYTVSSDSAADASAVEHGEAEVKAGAVERTDSGDSLDSFDLLGGQTAAEEEYEDSLELFLEPVEEEEYEYDEDAEFPDREDAGYAVRGMDLWLHFLCRLLL